MPSEHFPSTSKNELINNESFKPLTMQQNYSNFKQEQVNCNF